MKKLLVSMLALLAMAGAGMHSVEAKEGNNDVSCAVVLFEKSNVIKEELDAEKAKREREAEIKRHITETAYNHFVAIQMWYIVNDRY